MRRLTWPTLLFLPVVVALALLSAPRAAVAYTWGTLGTISDTEANRVCVGYPTNELDITCPSYSPSITTAGDVSVSGALEATRFIGDGSGLTGVGGTTMLVSLTDVSASGAADNRLLRYNATSTKWEGIGINDALSTTTMLPNFPDAIKCTLTDPTFGETVLYLNYNGIYGGPSYRLITSTNYYDVVFNNDGTFKQYNNIVSSNCNVSVSTLYSQGRAFNFIGSANSGGSAPSDRITSGTLAAIANSNTSYISLSTAGSTWGYLGSGASYLPNLTSTRISATSVQLASETTACTSGTAGRLSYVSGSVVLCNGTSWSNVGIGVPAGTIAAFASSACPSGWTEYTAARGRFLRGIDNGAGNDPDGTRAAGNVQTDAVQDHGHYVTNGAVSLHLNIRNEFDNGGADRVNRSSTYDADTFRATSLIATNGGTPRTASETRPKNVAVTFCQYTGIGGDGGGGGGSSDNLGDHTATQNLNMANYGIASAGIVTATYFEGDGSRLTGLASAATDRISTSGVSSGAQLGMAVADRGTVSFTLGGTAGAAYLHPTLGFVGPGVSTTGPVSATGAYFSGNVGIGTASPGQKLDIEQSATDYQMRIGDAGGNYYDVGRNTADGLLHFYGSQAVASGYVFDTVNGERMRITTAGNVGIGTANPNAKLEVAGGISASGVVTATYFEGNGSRLTNLPAGAESDPQVGTLGASKLCASNAGSSAIDCNTYGLATTGTASTAAIRDVNGDLTARYFYTTDGSNGIVQAVNGNLYLRSSGGANSVVMDSGSGGLNLSSGPLYVAGSSINLTNSSDAQLNIGGTGGNHYAYIDLMGDGTYTDYGLRLLRGNTGANAWSELSHRGTGTFYIGTIDDAQVNFNQNSVARIWLGTDDHIYTAASSNFVIGGTLYMDGNAVIDDGGGWHRSYGNTGWFNGTHGGGMYMTDSTWVQVYNGKAFYVANNVQANAYLHNSDLRLKDNVRDISGSISLIKNLKGVRFNWKKDGKPAYGLIAQDVRKAMPEAVSQGPKDPSSTTTPDGPLSVDYDQLIAPLIEAVKQQQRDIERLSADNDNLRKRLDVQGQEIRQMRSGAPFRLPEGGARRDAAARASAVH